MSPQSEELEVLRLELHRMGSDLRVRAPDPPPIHAPLLLLSTAATLWSRHAPHDKALRANLLRWMRGQGGFMYYPPPSFLRLMLLADSVGMIRSRWDGDGTEPHRLFASLLELDGWIAESVPELPAPPAVLLRDLSEAILGVPFVDEEIHRRCQAASLLVWMTHGGPLPR